MHSPQQNMRAAPAEPTSDDDSWADFVADTVMSMKPVSADVIRAVQVCDALGNFGANLRKPWLSQHTLSYPTTKIRTFWSHSWHGRAWKKYVTLLLFYHGTAALTVASMGAAVVSWLFSFEILPPLLQPGEEDTYFHCLWTKPVGLVLYCIVLLFGRRSDPVFLDVICIDQQDQTEKAKGILSIGAFLKSSDSMLVLWDATFCDRLWCMFEIAAFARSRSEGSKPKLLIRPTELTICHISQAATVLLVTIVSDFVPLSGDGGFMWALQAVNALIFGATFYANMAIYRGCFRSMEADGEKLARFSLASVKSSCCDDNHQASCGLCDRQITNKCITSWWGTREQFEEYVQTEVRAVLLSEHAKQFFTYRQAVSAMVPVLWLFLSKAAAWYRFTTFDPIMEASREVIRAVAWWLGVAPMALLTGTRLCYVFRRRCSWASADFLLNLPPLLGSVMVVVAAQQLEHLCSIIDFPIKPEEHGLVPNVLVFAALLLPATVGVFGFFGCRSEAAAAAASKRGASC